MTDWLCDMASISYSFQLILYTVSIKVIFANYYPFHSLLPCSESDSCMGLSVHNFNKFLDKLWGYEINMFVFVYVWFLCNNAWTLLHIFLNKIW